MNNKYHFYKEPYKWLHLLGQKILKVYFLGGTKAGINQYFKNKFTTLFRVKKLFARLIINTMSRESIHNQRIKELCSKSCPSLQVRPTEDKQKYAKGEEHIVKCKLLVRFSFFSRMLGPQVFIRLAQSGQNQLNKQVRPGPLVIMCHESNSVSQVQKRKRKQFKSTGSKGGYD